MKNQSFLWFLCITLVFIAFTAGFFLGRQGDSADIIISSANTAPIHTGSAPTVETTEAEEEIQFPIDINTAQIKELDALPGIGEALAKRIIAYREQHGPYSRPEELLHVDGIGKGKLEAILSLITTGG